jgi:8-oxo-dGTP pyrophosphatase MutT (NUDIX family)
MPLRGAKVIVIDPDNTVLVVRRSGTHPHAPYTPDLPGGKVEEGETMAEGLQRELKEETGIETATANLKKVGSKDDANYYGKVASVELYELRVTKRPKIVLDFEHDQHEWVNVKDLSIVAHLFESLVNEYKQQF